MYKTAIIMLFGDKGKYLGIVSGIALASILMIQQPSILLTILSHTYSLISDISLPDIWVMDPKVHTTDDSRSLLDTQLYRVRGIDGVQWAVPLHKGSQSVRLADGELTNATILGLDDATLIGGPGTVVNGQLSNLRMPDAVIVDENGARNRLAQHDAQGRPTRPLQIGDTVEINEKRAVIVGIAQAMGQAASTAADIPTLQNEIKQSIHRLGILLGLPPEALIQRLSKPQPLPTLSGPLLATGLPSQLLQRRPDVREAERKLAAASADIGVATADLYPKFDLTAGLGLQGSMPSRLAGFSTWYWSIIPGVSWPIFDAGEAQAAVAQKKALYKEALAAYKAAFHTALEDVENALAAYYTQREREQQLKASVTAYQEALDVDNERYSRGLTTFLTVLTDQASLYGAQTDLSKSRANVRTNIVSLYKALGGGWNVGATPAKAKQ